MPTALAPWNRVMRALALLLTAAPFVAALIARIGPRHDLRMLWMAIAATLSARLVISVTADDRARGAVAAIALLVATAVATGVAIILGARAGPGAGMVAVVLAGFATAGASLGRWLRSR
jgi:hypothetical protein